MLVYRVAFAAAETRSFKRASIVMKEVGDRTVSANTIERVVHDVGLELVQRRDADPRSEDALAQRPASPPVLAIVECDGGRIRTRETGHGRGVHNAGQGWRETKNACLIRASRKSFAEDPQPEPPECFSDPKHVAKIAETEALSVAASERLPSQEPVDQCSDAVALVPPSDWRPKSLVRNHRVDGVGRQGD